LARYGPSDFTLTHTSYWHYTSDEYNKTASHKQRGAGFQTLILALISTELKVASDFFQAIADFLGPKYEEGKQTAAGYAKHAQQTAEQYKEAGKDKLAEYQKKGEDYAKFAQDKASDYQKEGEKKGEQLKQEAVSKKEEAKQKAQK
jgi:hypothetical protein